MESLPKYTAVEQASGQIFTCSESIFGSGSDSLAWRQQLLNHTYPLAVWDLRRFIDWPLSDDVVVYDVKSIWGGDETLESLARRYPEKLGRLGELEAQVKAHVRAAKTAKIKLPTSKLIPPELANSLAHERAAAVQWLMSTIPFLSGVQPGNLAEFQDRWPFIRALREMELNGIAVDLPFIEKQLRSGSPDQSNKGALRSMQGLYRDGFVTTLYNPMGGKTGRCRHEGGFNALAIPHGPAREAIISRFEGGAIFGFDFNAIDYRCIVNSIGGELAELYKGATDFHERTASFIFKTITPAARKAIKFLSYIYIYGGSEETLVEKTGWTIEQVRQVLELLDKKIAPIKEFRERLWMQGQEDGFITAPGGRRLYLDENDSPGKAVGLYAQTFSSWVFEQSMVRAQRMLRTMKSKLIFAVHDELVVDAHPDEFEMMEVVRQSMQLDGYAVKMKQGRNYGQVE